jgi:hypothetical protein
VAADFFFISLRGKLDMHGVHGRRWSACVGCEDKKMAARLMKRSGATLIKDGGKPLVRKARKRKLVEEAGSKDVKRRMISWRDITGFEQKNQELRER